MSELIDLYQRVILDHNAEPRNFGSAAGATHGYELENRACGDACHVTLVIPAGSPDITEAMFTGAGCAIMKAAASLMTEAVRGRSVARANNLIALACTVVETGGADCIRDESTRDALLPLILVSAYPARQRCAALPWLALDGALQRGRFGKEDPLGTDHRRVLAEAP